MVLFFVLRAGAAMASALRPRVAAYCLNQACRNASALVYARPRSAGLFDPFSTKIPPSLAGTVQPLTWGRHPSEYEIPASEHVRIDALDWRARKSGLLSRVASIPTRQA